MELYSLINNLVSFFIQEDKYGERADGPPDVIGIKADEYKNEYGPEYGNKWLYFIDNDGTTHVMNFSTLPTDSRGLIFGNTYFNLYTRCNADKPELLNIPDDNSTIESTFFNPSNDIKIITHGWLSNDQTEWLQKMKTRFLSNYQVNVITVDWSEISNNPIYPWPALSTRYIGKKVAKILEALVNTYNVQGRSIHLIGHSLGAQVMGYAGMFSRLDIHRITGLDPARPLFELPPMDQNFRLEKSDAQFVDIIHTCGGIYGYKESHGHADFYPNNGRAKQPGCQGVQEQIEACSHGRSHEYFVESIDSNSGFRAYLCQNWEKFENGECKNNSTLMGYHTRNYDRGQYYLYTRNESKYAIEQ